MAVSSIKVQYLSELKAGDHIKWKRLPGYDHHAIVEWVDQNYNEVHVIEYGKRDSRDGKGRIRRSIIYGVTTMYKYIYDRCYDAGTVLWRAKSRLGETAYNLVRNNCEHFATWCKTGYEQCSQIPSAVRRIANGVWEGVSGAGGTVVGRCVAKCAVTAAERGTNVARELAGLTCRSFKNAVSSGGKAIGKNSLKSACKAGVIGVSSVLCEGALFGYTCYKACKNYKHAKKGVGDDKMEKERLKQQRNEEIKEAACEAVGAAIGGAALGTAVGSFIPVVGTGIGALIGGIGGGIIGKLFGRLFG